MARLLTGARADQWLNRPCACYVGTFPTKVVHLFMTGCFGVTEVFLQKTAENYLYTFVLLLGSFCLL